MASISRKRVLLRARYGWPQASVPFNNEIHQPSGYRQNALGYLSMCWGIPPHDPRTSGGADSIRMETDGWAYQIDARELKAGDALGLLGPSSVDTIGGVLVLFEHWAEHNPATGYAMTWQHLPTHTPGPNRALQPYDSIRWRCYRFRDIVDD